MQGFSQQQASENQIEVVILHTNDMHAKIDNLGKLSYLADSLRKSHPYLFLMSAGDNFTGNPVVDMVADKGYPMIDLMNQCGFNVSTIGNHEFDLGLDFLNRRIEQASFPFISCNIDVSGTILTPPKPYIVFDLGNGVEMVVIGVIELGVNGIPDAHPSKMEGLKFSDGIIAVQKYRDLKKDHEAMVALTHLGIQDDLKLAEAMPELDLIIGGHSHTLIDSILMVNGVVVTQAGAGLKYVGKATLVIENGHIIRINEEIIPLSAIKGTNKKIEENIRKYNSNPELKKVIARTENGIEGYDELGSMMTDALLHQMKVDFAFQNRGGIRINSIPPGEIRLSDIYKLDPFGNQIVIYDLYLEEIKSLIGNAFTREKGLDLEVAGMKYTVCTDKEGKLIRVEIYDNEDKVIDQPGPFKVAVNSYVAASYSFEHKDSGKTLYTTTAQALIDYLTVKKSVEYKGIKRINTTKVR